jgi:CxxC motif-containing protein (DUF1111 family)
MSHRIAGATFLCGCALLIAASAFAQDPGPRPGADAGSPLPTLTADQLDRFQAGQAVFVERETVDQGLGPRFNLDSCAGCHAQPAVGGTSPTVNPQVEFLTRTGGSANKLPAHIRADGPVLEMRFIRDGAVHQTFAIDQPPCDLQVGPFPPGQLALRQPTPVFGLGLVEAIADSVILANQQADAALKQALGIAGTPQAVIDGRIGRFGWKAQHGDVEAFAAEAYNVEMGITTLASPTETETDPSCQFAPVPNNIPDGTAPDDVELFADFMRGLAPPTPVLPRPSPVGEMLFVTIGCSLCHTPLLGAAPLYSDLLLHHMGKALADGVTQASAAGDQFRTAPLWGVGQRIFFLHDGRTQDLHAAILAHQSRGSEASGVIATYEQLTPEQQHDVLVFLRGL